MTPLVSQYLVPVGIVAICGAVVMGLWSALEWSTKRRLRDRTPIVGAGTWHGVEHDVASVISVDPSRRAAGGDAGRTWNASEYWQDRCKVAELVADSRIEAAVMVERERCAKAANCWRCADDRCDTSLMDCRAELPHNEQIAAAIRKGPQ